MAVSARRPGGACESGTCLKDCSQAGSAEGRRRPVRVLARENAGAGSQADYEASFSAYIVQPVSVGPENREMFTALRN